MKRILVTGAQGFIGKNLISHLAYAGHDVFGLDSEYLSHPDWKVRLSDKLESFFPEVIFHVGACAGTLEKRVNFMMIRNYESTKMLAIWCKKNNVSLIYSSSAAVYGETGDCPSNLYGWSKYVAEDYVLSTGGIALRYFNVYGPGEENKGDMASVMYQAFSNYLESGKAVGLFPNFPRRDFVYIEDIISANMHAYENYDRFTGRYFEVGSGEAETFEEAMESLGVPYYYLDANNIPDGYQFFTQSDRKKWMSGWSPDYDLKKGIGKYLENLNEGIR